VIEILWGLQFRWNVIEFPKCINFLLRLGYDVFHLFPDVLRNSSF